MAASIPIEEESGRYSGRIHPHNGYYAGDFTRPRGGLTSTPARPRAASNHGSF